jgi:hypothetical protein
MRVKLQAVYSALNEAKYLCVIHIYVVFLFSKRSLAYADQGVAIILRRKETGREVEMRQTAFRCSDC